MKTHFIALALIALPLLSGGALAGETCTIPQGMTAQSVQALQQKLEGEGWQIEQITLENGCYQVTAIKADGTRLDSSFDPVTLAAAGDAVSEDEQIADFLKSVKSGGAGGDDNDDDEDGNDSDSDSDNNDDNGDSEGEGDDD